MGDVDKLERTERRVLGVIKLRESTSSSGGGRFGLSDEGRWR